ncbi:hypothetical protein EQH57_0232, partial [Dictyocoela roeselum]
SHQQPSAAISSHPSSHQQPSAAISSHPSSHQQPSKQPSAAISSHQQPSAAIQAAISSHQQPSAALQAAISSHQQPSKQPSAAISSHPSRQLLISSYRFSQNYKTHHPTSPTIRHQPYGQPQILRWYVFHFTDYASSVSQIHSIIVLLPTIKVDRNVDVINLLTKLMQLSISY